MNNGWGTKRHSSTPPRFALSYTFFVFKNEDTSADNDQMSIRRRVQLMKCKQSAATDICQQTAEQTKKNIVSNCP